MPVTVFGVTDAEVVLGGEPVLQHVTLTVGGGEFLALLGQNGSGKTTLLRALLGLQSLTRGRIDVLGTPVADFGDWHRIGYVPQSLLAAGAVPVSVREVVAAGLISPRRRLARIRSSNGVSSALDRVGLADRASDAFHTLSGGQQRRAMIASVLAKGADVLLLDEPTAGVDAANVRHLGEILHGLRDEGATIVLVTHELGVLADLVGRVVVLGPGGTSSIRYDGPPPAPDTLRDPHGHHEPPSAPQGWTP